VAADHKARFRLPRRKEREVLCNPVHERFGKCLTDRVQISSDALKTTSTPLNCHSIIDVQSVAWLERSLASAARHIRAALMRESFAFQDAKKNTRRSGNLPKRQREKSIG